MLKQVFLIPAMLLVLSATSAVAQQTVFLVRHAERADKEKGAPQSEDSDLSNAGRARAESLATLLKDANLTAIFITKFRRTAQTAAPLAKVTGLSPTILEGTNLAEIAKEIRAQKGNVLIVGHSNTVPDIIKGLGITTPVKIGDQDFDNLFIVTSGAKPELLQLHYR